MRRILFPIGVAVTGLSCGLVSFTVTQPIPELQNQPAVPEIGPIPRPAPGPNPAGAAPAANPASAAPGKE